MREIKFRAWDKDDEVMRGWREVELTKDSGDDYYLLGYKENIAITNYDHEQVLMQFTGLEDKNGVNIYEGDIVKITNTKRFLGGNHKCYSNVVIMGGQVHVWVDPVINGKRVRHGAKLLHGGSGKYIDMRGVATDDVEVKGNIYENSELLEDNS